MTNPQSHCQKSGSLGVLLLGILVTFVVLDLRVLFLGLGTRVINLFLGLQILGLVLETALVLSP